jgi:peptide/nickel transport system permease protein
MSAYVVFTKVTRAVVTMWFVATFSFVILSLSGDPIEIMAGDDAPLDVIEYYKELYGFNRPLHEQYVSYMEAILRGDFGISYADDTPALDLVLEAVPNTLILGFSALALALSLGIFLGFVAALNRNSWLDRTIMSFAVFGFSIPNFFLGILLILLFAMVWRLLPSAGDGSLAHLILPVITMGTSGAASIARFMRSSVLDVLNQPYIRAAKAKGVPTLNRLLRHVFPNAAIPVITILGFRLGDLVAGAIVVETVFAWPGMGRLLVGAVLSRELAIVQTILILTAFTMVIANLLVDMLYGWVDPRVRGIDTAKKR